MSPAGPEYETRPPAQVVCPVCRGPRCPGARRVGGRPRRPGRRTAGLAGAVVLAAYGLLAAGPSQAAPGGADCAALAAQMSHLAGERVGPLLLWYEGRGSGDEMLSGLGGGGRRTFPPPADPLPRQLVEAVGGSATGTNTWERAVDEPDVAKVDGTRVLRLWGARHVPYDEPARANLSSWRLSIVDASTGQPRLLGTFAPGGKHVAYEMFALEGHRVLVVGSVTEPSPRPGDPERTDKVQLTLLDTTDPAATKVLRVEKLTGRYVSARMARGLVRVVVTTPPPIRVLRPLPYEPWALTKARNRAALRALGGQDWLPVREVLDGSGRLVARGPAMACADVHRPADPADPELVSVVTVDTRAGADALDGSTATGVVGRAEDVYASAERLYVASGRRAAGRIALHGFDTSGRAGARHVASGSLRGRLLGGSALSWHDGHLRVAVQGLSGRRGNHVVVLAERAGRLREVGRVGRMGVGEAIRSVRWFGDLATLVTFRQVDPFYVVDLSRPAQPRVLGELKVPGYSGYLHPVGDGRVLGVGRDGTPGGDLTGAQMSLFDVTDPARPRRLSRLSLGPSSADVERDHRTFAYLPEHRLAVLSGWFGRGLSAGPSVLGVRVGADGSLREVGHRRAARNIQRMLPVAGRLVLVSGTRVAVLDPVTFARLGRVDLRGS